MTKANTRNSNLVLRVFAFLLSSSLIAIAAPGVADFKGYPVDKVGMGAELLERGFENSKFSEIFLVKDNNDGSSSAFTTCLEFGVGDCDPAKFGKGITVMGYLVMPPCRSEADRDCIESLKIGIGDQLESAQLIREVAGTRIPANGRFGIPRSGMPSLWRAPGVEHLGGTDTYAVQFLTEIFIERGAVRYDFVSARIQPYVETEDPQAETTKIEPSGNFGSQRLYRVSGPRDQNVFDEDGVTGLQAEFAPDTRLSLTIRAAQQVGGWLRSRLDAPEIKVSPIDTKYNRVSVTGTAVEVPKLAGKFTSTEWSNLVQKKGLSNDRFNPDSGVGIVTDDGFEWAKAIIAASNDTAQSAERIWSFATLNLGTNPCYADKTKLQGIVNTNAAVYGSSAPPLENGFLSYKVAGAHYLPTGELAKGSYDLIIRSDLARCLYGFSNAPVSATISVYGGAEQQVATTIVRESAGWITLTARNFTFSEKQIRAKITQPQSLTTSAFSGRSSALAGNQKFQIRNLVQRSKGNTKLVCTATYLKPADRSLALMRAKSACSYANSVGKKYSTFAQAKLTSAKSFDAKVMLVTR